MSAITSTCCTPINMVTVNGTSYTIMGGGGPGAGAGAGAGTGAGADADEGVETRWARSWVCCVGC